MTAPTITTHCATCSGPVVSDPDAVLCRACWARENAPSPAPGGVDRAAFEAIVDDLVMAVEGEYASDAESYQRARLAALVFGGEITEEREAVKARLRSPFAPPADAQAVGE